MNNIKDLTSLPSSTSTSLGDQILFMETICKFMTMPILSSVVSSLKELRGVKASQLEKLKSK